VLRYKEEISSVNQRAPEFGESIGAARAPNRIACAVPRTEWSPSSKLRLDLGEGLRRAAPAAHTRVRCYSFFLRQPSGD